MVLMVVTAPEVKVDRVELYKVVKLVAMVQVLEEMLKGMVQLEELVREMEDTLT